MSGSYFSKNYLISFLFSYALKPFTFQEVINKLFLGHIPSPNKLFSPTRELLLS